MTKIVINTCFGGFGLSKEAILLGRKLSGDPLWGGACLKGDQLEGWKSPMRHDYSGGDDLDRDDPLLIRVVEELGKKADGDCAKLSIVDLPKGTLYRIDEYDGRESIETMSDDYWKVA